jgi:hypothetical protein
MNAKRDSAMTPVLMTTILKRSRRGAADTRALRVGLATALAVVLLGSGALLTAARQSAGARALVRHGFTVDGRVEGAIQLLAAEDTTLNGGAAVTGDLFAPWTPTLSQKDAPAFGGVAQGSGAEQPAGYEISLNGDAQLGRLVTRTDPVTMPSVEAPPSAAGTRDVMLSAAGQSAGDFSSVRDLTLGGDAGLVAVPPGTYRSLAASGGGFILGVAGSTEPAVYHLDSLTLNEGGRLQVAGPVVLHASAVTLSDAAGAEAHPLWLALKVAAGGVTLNGGGVLYGSVTTPAGAVTINGNGLLVGNVVCDRLSVNSGGVLRIVQ